MGNYWGRQPFKLVGLIHNDGLHYASIFAKKYDTLIWYSFVVMVRVRYGGTLFELKIPDSSHMAPDFCMQRRKTAEAEAKCVN